MYISEILKASLQNLNCSPFSLPLKDLLISNVKIGTNSLEESSRLQEL